nr:MAG TPA: hypothetical protein [Caudoviricetes sp.]DAO85650.1 MAG TPA: hypothetical protein [Caudoviricetes sp.]
MYKYETSKHSTRRGEPPAYCGSLSQSISNGASNQKCKP